jgi:hypothetical protein
VKRRAVSDSSLVVVALGWLIFGGFAVLIAIDVRLTQIREFAVRNSFRIQLLALLGWAVLVLALMLWGP